MRGAAAIVALALVTGAAPDAHAQVVDPKDYPVERLRLAMDGGGVLDAESGAVPAPGTWVVGLWMGVANDPLVVYAAEAGEGGDRAGALVTDRIGGSLLLSYALAGWVQVGVEVPLILHQDRDAMLAGGGMLSGLTAAGIGDLRLTPKLGLRRGPLHLALIPALTLPTGGDGGYFGERTVTFAPQLAASRDLGAVRLAGNLGYRTRGNSADLGLTVEDELFARAALGYRLGHRGGPPVDLGVGLTGAVPASAPVGNGNANALELLASVGYQLGPVQVFGGGGLGIEAGYGVPDWRLFVGTRYTRAPARAAARAHDEALPPMTPITELEPVPEPDRDGDGLLDAGDACPREPEDVDSFADGDGCPELDNDGDGRPDATDRCPGDPEDADGFEDDDGCPDLDDDRDGLAEPGDRCPQQAETYNDVDDGDGCPDGDALVEVSAEQLRVNETVRFDVQRARINRASFPLLNAVAAALIAHADLRVRIDGHTDDSGGEAFNLELSHKRASAVREYLISKGVDGERLEAQGHGERQPKVAGKTRKARDANRRVEFTIVAAPAAPEPAPEPAPARSRDPDGLE